MSGEAPKRYEENGVEYISIPVEDYDQMCSSYEELHNAMTEMIIERDLNTDQHTCKSCIRTHAQPLESDQRICNMCMFKLMAEYIGYRQPNLPKELHEPLVTQIIELMVGIQGETK